MCEVTTMRSEIGTRIRVEREAVGLSKRRLAKIIQVEPSTITRWESGKHAVPAPHLKLIADALGVTVMRLHGDAPAQQTSPVSAS